MSALSSVLAKKLRHSGVSRSPLAETDVIVASFARGIEDQLRAIIKTSVSVTVGMVGVTKLSGATAGIETPAMIGVVEVEDADTPALIAFDAGLANHLVDLTLGGDPGQNPEFPPRALTAIDMALGRVHLDAILAAFVKAVGVGLGRPLTRSLRIREQRQSLAQLRIAPDYIDVLSFALEITIGDAWRSGQIALVLPLSSLDVIRASVQERRQSPRDRPNDLWQTMMRRAAAAAPVRVDAVLHRQTLTLAALQNLKVGQVIEIPRQAVEEIRLTMPQPGGRAAVLASGRLGAYQDRKVVKLVSAPDARVAASIRKALQPGTAALPPAAPVTPERRQPAADTDTDAAAVDIAHSDS